MGRHDAMIERDTLTPQHPRGENAAAVLLPGSFGRHQLVRGEPVDLLDRACKLANLLTVIKAEAQLLERTMARGGRRPPERAHERLAAIIATVDRAAVEVHGISGGRVLKPEVLDGGLTDA